MRRHPLTLRRVQLTRRTRVRIIFISLLVLALTTLCAAALALRPLLTSLATARVSNTVNRIVSEAVNETIENGDIRYEDLISFEKDAEGRITALKSNMAQFNRLQADILDDVLAQLAEVSTRELSIPVGSLTGSSLLAGRGPLIHVRMQTVGSSKADFSNSFTSAGINQTRHQIILDVHVSVSILLPGFKTSTSVDNTYTVAETVIVGTVPQNYVYFHAAGNEEVEDFILNNAG